MTQANEKATSLVQEITALLANGEGIEGCSCRECKALRLLRHAQAEIEGLQREKDEWKQLYDETHARYDKAFARWEAAEARAEAAEGMNRELSNLTGAMAAQDEREANAGERCGVLRELHGCDWPDAVAERLLTLEQALQEIARLRLATDEGSLRVRSDRMWEVCEAALAASRGREPEPKCANGHVWSNDYGDDWYPEEGRPCDCGQRLAGHRGEPSKSRGREPERT